MNGSFLDLFARYAENLGGLLGVICGLICGISWGFNWLRKRKEKGKVNVDS